MPALGRGSPAKGLLLVREDELGSSLSWLPVLDYVLGTAQGGGLPKLGRRNCTSEGLGQQRARCLPRRERSHWKKQVTTSVLFCPGEKVFSLSQRKDREAVSGAARQATKHLKSGFNRSVVECLFWLSSYSGCPFHNVLEREKDH